MDVSLNVLMRVKTISGNLVSLYLLTAAKVNVDFANCVEQPLRKSPNVSPIVLLVNKNVSTLAMLERPNVLLAEFSKLYKF